MIVRRASPLLFSLLIGCALCAAPIRADELEPQLVADAREASAQVVGPTSAQPGQRVTLEATSQTKAAYAWLLVEGQGTWLAVDGGSRVQFETHRPGRYTFALVAALVDGERVQPAITLHTLVVEGQPNPPPGPAPGPNPVPPPDPQPEPLPEGRFNLAVQAVGWSAAVRLPPADRARTAQHLANAFEAATAPIAAGTVHKIPEALELVYQLTAQSNAAALTPAEHQAWRDGFNEPLKAAIKALHSARQIRNVHDVATAWQEIAIGLRSVR